MKPMFEQKRLDTTFVIQSMLFGEARWLCW